MDWNTTLSTFGLIFLAEIGDKTQLATVTMVARTGAPGAVFLGASLALVAVTLLGVLGGSVVTRWVSPEVLQRIAAVSFIAIGAWMLIGEAG
ncbi:MAG: TMEM165/GDT1 family protein [Candidatus Binatia bacterium]|nr:TMEM165/GDT1 family protein [Candidatus Binatia bacterium]